MKLDDLPPVFSLISAEEMRLFLREVFFPEKIARILNAEIKSGMSTYEKDNVLERRFTEVYICHFFDGDEFAGARSFCASFLETGHRHMASEFLEVLKVVYEQASPTDRKQIKSKIAGQIAQPQGLIPLAHEINTAHALMKVGFEVQFLFPEASESVADIEARKGDLTLGVECKSVAADTGRLFKVHDVGMAIQSIKDFAHRYPAIFRDRSLIVHAEGRVRLSSLADVVGRALAEFLRGSVCETIEGYTVELLELDFDGELKPILEQREYVMPEDQAKEIVNLIKCRKENFVYEAGAFLRPVSDYPGFIVAFGSSSTSRWMDVIRRNAREAAQTQLKQYQHSLLSVRLVGLNAQDYENFFWAHQNPDPNDEGPLQPMAGDIFNSPMASNLGAILFFGDPKVRETGVYLPNGKPSNRLLVPTYIAYNALHADPWAIYRAVQGGAAAEAV